jgi:hypothetical protein
MRRGKTLSFGSEVFLKHKTKRAIDSIILMNKVKKINRFFNKYKDLLFKKKNRELDTTLQLSNLSNKPSEFTSTNDIETINLNNITTVYKLNFLKEILDKELLYIYYIKMVSFNNSLFKN